METLSYIVSPSIRVSDSHAGSPMRTLFTGMVLVLGAGMALTTSSTGGQAGQATFTKDIAPILQRSCQNCHRPDSIAPMSLITYEEVRPWARAMKERTLLRRGRGA